jgi:hypothetical protein
MKERGGRIVLYRDMLKQTTRTRGRILGLGREVPSLLLQILFDLMLYTRFVIGEETLSSTSVFNFCHCAIFSTTIKSLIEGPFNGH